jgi:hypothetical protein
MTAILLAVAGGRADRAQPVRRAALAVLGTLVVSAAQAAA